MGSSWKNETYETKRKVFSREMCEMYEKLIDIVFNHVYFSNNTKQTEMKQQII